MKIHSWMVYMVGVVTVSVLAVLKAYLSGIPFIEAASSITSMTLAWIAKRHLDKKINGNGAQ